MVERQISAKVRQIIKEIDMCNIELNQLSKYPTDFLATVFDVSDMDYYTRIKLFNIVLNRKGVCMDHQEWCALFEKIYEEGMREKKWENSRDGR